MMTVVPVSVIYLSTLNYLPGMERKEFFTALAGSAAAICIGGLAACSKSAITSNGNVSPFSVDLGASLLNVGDVMVHGDVVIIRTATGDTASSFVALSNICTHQGCTVEYNATRGDMECPCHGAKYSTEGAVTQGPASSPLKKYTVSVNGNSLTIS
ncbi:MAG: Rieske (2Fe-2S) protein [Chitinophagaceae bacterium]